MNIQIKTILNSLGALQELQNLTLPGSVSHDVTRLILKLKPELDIYDETRNKVSQKYMEMAKELPEDMPENERADKQAELNVAFQKEIQELDENEIDIRFRKINGRVLTSVPHKPSMTVHLAEWLIEMPEEDESDESYV